MKVVVNELYGNLRKNYSKLITHILGDSYYNMGGDVFATDDMACKDLIKAYDDVKKENKTLRAGIWAMFAIIGILCWGVIWMILA